VPLFLKGRDVFCEKSYFWCRFLLSLKCVFGTAFCEKAVICVRRDDLFHRGRDRDSGRDGLCNRGHNALIRLYDGQLNYNRVDVATRCKYSVDTGNHCMGIYKTVV
jgi:hypothetical protein